jgi:hypothetical protein
MSTRNVTTAGRTTRDERTRFVGFLRAERVVSLETGYSSQGRLVLSVRQLIELARAVLR